MGLVSFVGRVLFTSVFMLSAWQKFNDFGGGVKIVQPKIAMLNKNLGSMFGSSLPAFELKYFVLAALILEGLGSLLFIFGSSIGAAMLIVFLAIATPIMHDFYNFEYSSPQHDREFIQFLKNMAMFGALLFFLGMKNQSRLRKKHIKVKSV